VLRRVGTEPAGGFLQLSLAPDPVAALGLVPRDGNVDEPLEEVALLLRRRSPGVFELLVGREELATADQV
jgi:hypothetical protein